MNRHALIVVVSCTVMTASFAYVLMGVIAADNLQLRWHDDDFNLALLINGGQIYICNPSIIPVNLHGFEISIRHMNLVSVFEVPPTYVPANELAGVYGQMPDSTALRAAFRASPDTTFLGSAMEEASEALDITTRAHITIFGFIPVTMENYHSASSLVAALRDTRGTFECAV